MVRRADAPDELEAVEARHHPVADDDGEVALLQELPGLGAVEGLRDLVPARLQVAPEDAADDRIVLDDQDPHRVAPAVSEARAGPSRESSRSSAAQACSACVQVPVAADPLQGRDGLEGRPGEEDADGALEGVRLVLQRPGVAGRDGSPDRLEGLGAVVEEQLGDLAQAPRGCRRRCAGAPRH